MTKANSEIGKGHTILFTNLGQEIQIASPVFRVDKSLNIRPALQTSGSLDGGIVNLQVLKEPLQVSNADNSAGSTDWENTDDVIFEKSYSLVDYSRRPHRILVTNSGAGAAFSASVTYNL